jgi:hypothetical protein
VYARNAGSSASYQVFKTLPYAVGADLPTEVSLIADKVSPQEEGATVTFSAQASGGIGNYEYKFIISGPGTDGQWAVVQEYSPVATYSWDTTGAVGTSTILVYARNAGSSASYQVYRTTTFRID